MLISAGLSDVDEHWFREHGVEVRKYPFPVSRDLWNAAPVEHRLPPSSLLKYYIFTREFAKWDTVIYLDTDVVVMGPLCEPSGVEVFGAVPEPALSVRDQFDATNVHGVGLAKVCRLDRRSFNFGMFIVRPAAIPAGTYDRLCELSEHWLSAAIWGEQSIANICLWKVWKPIPQRYNYNPVLRLAGGRFSWCLRPLPFSMSPPIVHFYGPQKPWNRRSPYRRIWLRNLRAAGSLTPGNRSFVHCNGSTAFSAVRLVGALLLWILLLFKRTVHVFGVALRGNWLRG